jgi:NhaP-type Na+/H+ or K+/H+ antiporter
VPVWIHPGILTGAAAVQVLAVIQLGSRTFLRAALSGASAYKEWVEIGFPEALLAVGLLLVVAASLSGVMHGTVLSISVFSVAAGIVLAESGIVSVDAEDQTVVQLVELALILTLFADGLLVDRELLWLHWTPPARAIAFAMPITLVLLAGAALVLFPELSWEEAFLLAAVLTPTDPVVTSSVVSAPGVPAAVRHTLNLESGLNDGLALPFVLFFLVLAAHSGDAAPRRRRCSARPVSGR